MSQTKVYIKDTVLIIAGIFSVAMGLKGFLLSSHFIDGGVTGISMLIANLTGWSLSVMLPLFNLPFLILGYYQIGRSFAIKSALGIAGLALCIAVVPFPDVTPDLLLTAIFGGVFIGAGIGLAMRGGAVLDGTEAAALLLSRRSSLLRVGDIILVINVFIFGAAAFSLGVDVALYSMITYFGASKAIDFLVHGIEEHTAVLIVSDHAETVRLMLTEELGKGVTVLKGQKGYGKRGHHREATDVLYTVVTRLELSRLRDAVELIDPNVFMIQHGIDDARGGLVKGRPLH
ncbi:YitT family protein [Rudanella lutea]|uniref:YitT family protein n=1 Tax=Rudanella lutea TaxID=451374 RepID=UPI0003706F7A|nr:YitT family protein [Rudanella lutea]